MKISNRVKRNISGVLIAVGILAISLASWKVAENPSSGKAWFELGSIILLTYLQFDSFRSYQKLLNEGILIGKE